MIPVNRAGIPCPQVTLIADPAWSSISQPFWCFQKTWWDLTLFILDGSWLIFSLTSTLFFCIVAVWQPAVRFQNTLFSNMKQNGERYIWRCFTIYPRKCNIQIILPLSTILYLFSEEKEGWHRCIWQTGGKLQRKNFERSQDKMVWLKSCGTEVKVCRDRWCIFVQLSWGHEFFWNMDHRPIGRWFWWMRDWVYKIMQKHIFKGNLWQ